MNNPTCFSCGESMLLLDSTLSSFCFNQCDECYEAYVNRERLHVLQGRRKEQVQELAELQEELKDLLDEIFRIETELSELKSAA